MAFALDLVADTNAMIAILAHEQRAIEALDGKRVGLSVISEMELLSFSRLSDAEEAAINEMVAACLLLELSQSVKTTAINLRRRYHLKLPDAIVAASALAVGAPLLTADADFHRISELSVVPL